MIKFFLIPCINKQATDILPVALLSFIALNNTLNQARDSAVNGQNELRHKPLRTVPIIMTIPEKIKAPFISFNLLNTL